MNYILTTTSVPNFCDKNGNAYLVKCPLCKKENYTPNVSTGICTFCNFDLNEHKIIDNDSKSNIS